MSYFRHAKYYEAVVDPIDLSTIDRNISSGRYSGVSEFTADFERLFANAEASLVCMRILMLFR